LFAKIGILARPLDTNTNEVLMKILAVIPARYGSSRFPGKPLIDLKGKTMIRRVYEGVKRSALISEVVVATDDERIYKEVQSFGGNCIMTSPDHPSGTDRCAEVTAQFIEMDIVINVQGDEPLVDHRQLEQLLTAFNEPSTTIATLASRSISIEDLGNPNRIKLVVNAHGKAMYFSRSSVPNHQHSKWNAIEHYPYLRHIGLYAYRRDTLLELTQLQPTLLEQTESLEQLRWMYYGYQIGVVETTIETPNIDVPEDVDKVLIALG
jgi:3-deoxy-manno-octulosonate cytidylyltransferase (CMP-KDO synthetase)